MTQPLKGWVFFFCRFLNELLYNINMKRKPKFDYNKAVNRVVKDALIDNPLTTDAVREAYLLGLIDGSTNQELADYALKKLTEK